MRCRAFTLIELLVTISITVILVGLLTPVFGRVKEHVQIRVSLDRLRQLSIATLVYRQDWGNGSDYSSIEGVSLPPYGYVYGTYMGFGRDFFRSPCGYKESIEPNKNRISYGYFPTPFPVYLDHLKKREEGAMLFGDPHCNAEGIPWLSRFYAKRGLGVTIGGQLHNAFKNGDAGSPEWWVTRQHLP